MLPGKTPHARGALAAIGHAAIDQKRVRVAQVFRMAVINRASIAAAF
jgi:hypothetical protein